jgi:putative PIN family toxin of toxin-antitoxin system
MLSKLPGVVFDCNIFLQALVNPKGAACACLALFESGEIELYVSAQVLAEVAEVLSRPKVRQLAPSLTLETIEAFVENIRDKAICLRNVPDEYHFERDPKDEPYLNLAIIANATYLVSKDNDLLDLMTTQKAEARNFRLRYPLLKILTAPAFLQEMRQRDLSLSE